MGHPRRAPEMRISPAGKIHQPGNLSSRTNSRDYRPLPLPAIDHVNFSPLYLSRMIIGKQYTFFAAAASRLII